MTTELVPRRALLVGGLVGGLGAYGGAAAALVGNLNANGVSPAQWGFRANDASGNPIFDSQGLIKQTQLASDIPTAGGVVTNDGSVDGVVLPGSGTTFSVTRAVTILVWGHFSGQVSPAGSYTRNAVYIKQGATTIGQVFCGYSNSTVIASGFGQFWIALPSSGTYTLECHSKNSSGFTTTYSTVSAQCQLVGG